MNSKTLIPNISLRMLTDSYAPELNQQTIKISSSIGSAQGQLQYILEEIADEVFIVRVIHIIPPSHAERIILDRSLSISPYTMKIRLRTASICTDTLYTGPGINITTSTVNLALMRRA